MPESLPKRFVFLVLTFLSHVPQHSCIDVITSERNKMPQEDGHFVIPGLDLNSLNTFTMCGRFNIYQFIVHSEVINRTYEYEAYTEALQGIFPGFATYSLIYDDEISALIPEAERKMKHVFVLTYIFGENKVLPNFLKPGEWNTFCLKVNNTTAILKLNEEKLITENDQTLNKSALLEFATKSQMQNYLFMNLASQPISKSPMYGAVTDINVWDTILPDEELEEWKNCSRQKGGNVYSWHKSSKNIKLNGLKKVNESFGNICQGKENYHLMPGIEELNFEETLNYCNKVGSMAVISNNEIAKEINRTLDLYKKWDAYEQAWINIFPATDVYTGYTDIEKEGDWVVHKTDKKLT